MNQEYRNLYEDARKAGVRKFNTYKSRGDNPYLPALDDILAKETILSEVSLGNQDIMLKKIKGTKTNGRKMSFAPNYMPLLKQNSEFGTKWMHLCEAHVTEGIRDSIKVYEYMNWYYVEEGNKRVSVLKFYEAVSISANITRLVPKYDENDINIKIYYEFMEFYNKTKINYIWFTKLDSFKKMLQYIQKYNLVTDDFDDTEFSSFHHYFRKTYHALGGGEVKGLTTGDAMLIYLDIYGYEPNLEMNIMVQNITKVFEEFEVFSSDEEVEVEVTTNQLEKKSLFSSLLPFNLGSKKAKIAFINSKSPESSSWTYGHEIGRLHLENVFGNEIETKAFHNVPESDEAYEVMMQAVKEGYNIIFTTTPSFAHQTLKAAVDTKGVSFLNCSENISYKNVRTYFGRIYEPNFLVGLIAGAMTKTNNIGYVVTYPIPEVISSINAFTLGARFVNPYAKVYIKWVENYEMDAEKETYLIDNQLRDLGVDIISHQESSDLTTKLKNSGIYFINDDEPAYNEKEAVDKHKYLATPVWNWGVFYEKIVHNIRVGNSNSIFGQSEKAINYWWGMDLDVVSVFYSKSSLSPQMIKTMEFMKESIIRGHYHPFTGPILDQKRNVRVAQGEILSPEEIQTMDWFVYGVVGSIPTINTNNENHPLLDLISVRKKY